MIAQLASGKEVLLPDPVEIGVDPSYDLDMTMPGAIFKDTLRDMNGDFMPNQTIELIDVELGEDAAVMIMTDEEGNFSYGPLPEGNYYYRGDVDNDGWYDFNESAFVNSDISNITLALNVPETVDVTLTLVSPVDPLTQEPCLTWRIEPSRSKTKSTCWTPSTSPAMRTARFTSNSCSVFGTSATT